MVSKKGSVGSLLGFIYVLLYEKLSIGGKYDEKCLGTTDFGLFCPFSFLFNRKREEKVQNGLKIRIKAKKRKKNAG